LSPTLRALAEACYPNLDWLKAIKAAEALAIELKLPEARIEQVFQDQYTPCQCTCCGHKHSIVRRRGIYFNKRLVSELYEEAFDQECRIARRDYLFGALREKT